MPSLIILLSLFAFGAIDWVVGHAKAELCPIWTLSSKNRRKSGLWDEMNDFQNVPATACLVASNLSGVSHALSLISEKYS
jgi:hypothetical protein